MSPDQFDRWKDFSIRMACHAFPSATQARRLKIEKEVAAFFSWYDRDSEEVAKITDWDNSPSYICDQVDNHLESHQHYRYNHKTGCEEPHGNKFENQVSCCIRAGLDCASEPSCGVIGFTVGDLRRMYPEGVPDWVTAGYQPPITASTPDNAGVWL
ncbi:hypothetical protein [Rhizobium rhizogenes]|uniref:hypothetical protein n=1 Tax=Rhizobium rhizogenes TaxID=359 RepID=UPI0015735E06|nr:hypothetical protein [Rhizobium rhizogenes]NTG07179.1 hypothetical protein [Rhizobium rhizogenes]